jgi:flagellar FliL protein
MTAAASRENRWASAGGNAAPKSGGTTGRPGGAPEAAAPPAAPAKPKNKKLMIMILVAVLVVGGGAYMFFKPKPKYVPSAGETVTLEPITVNLTGGHYLKVTLAVVLLKEKASAKDFETAAAAELVIDEFANRSVASLSTNEARRKLTTDLFGKLKKEYPDEIFKIHLPQFVSQ